MDGDGSDEIRFPSKRDTWLMVILWCSAIAMVVFGVFCVLLPIPPALGVIVALVLVSGAVVTVWPLYSTAYILTGETLVIRCGPLILARVRIGSIREIVPSRSVVSAPACSLDRLRITYGLSSRASSRVLVSPRDKEAFIAAILERAPHVVVGVNGGKTPEGAPGPRR